MAIYISNNIDKSFIVTTLRDCYLMYLRSNLFTNRVKKLQIEHMNDYLTKNYNVDLELLFRLIADNTYIGTQGDNYKLTINDNVIVNKNNTLGMLMRLVDYGNTEIRGLHIFNKVEKFIQERIQAIFTIHTLKNMKKED